MKWLIEIWKEADFWEKNVYIFAILMLLLFISWLVIELIMMPLAIIPTLILLWFLFCVSKI